MADEFLILKLDEASAEAVPTRPIWVQHATFTKPEAEYTSAPRLLREWLEGQSAVAAGEYMVIRLDTFGTKRFTVCPRVEWDVDEREPEKDDAGKLEVVA